MVCYVDRSAGTQASRRAEFIAAFAGSAGGAALWFVITECEYVSCWWAPHGCAGSRRGGGPDGDFWALFPDRVPAVGWMRSHQPGRAVSVGAARTDWEWNAQADTAAVATLMGGSFDPSVMASPAARCLAKARGWRPE